MIELVGCSLTGAEAIEQTKFLAPDLVLMDIAMPDMNGLDATRRIKELENPPRVIILTLHDNLEYRMASQAAHADGYIAKSEFGAELLPQIHLLFELEEVT